MAINPALPYPGYARQMFNPVKFTLPRLIFDQITGYALTVHRVIGPLGSTRMALMDIDFNSVVSLKRSGFIVIDNGGPIILLHCDDQLKITEVTQT